MAGFNLGAVIATIKADASGFKAGIDDAKNHLRGFSSNIQNINSELDDFRAKATIAATAVGAGLAFAAKQGIEQAAKFEQYQVAFTTLLKDQEKARQAIKDIEKDAKSTPFELAPLVQANQLLISAGRTTSQARDEVKWLGNAIAATGGGEAELSRLAANMQQIQATGKASATDIKQFAFAGINIYKLLSDATGKSVEEVKNMDVSYDLLADSLQKASEKGGMFEGAMEKQSGTLNGLMSTLSDTINLGLKDILVDSGAFDMIRDAVARLIPFLEGTAVPAIVNFFKVISGGFGLLGDVLKGENVLPEVQEFLSYFMGGEIPDENHPAVRFFYGIADAIKFVGQFISEHQAVILLFLQGLGIALGALLIVSTITALLTAMMNPLVWIALGIAALYVAWQTDFMGMQSIMMNVFYFFQGIIITVVMPIIAQLTTWFRQNWTAIQLITQGVFNIIVGILQWAMGLILAITAVAMGILTGNWDAANQQIQRAAKMVYDGVISTFSGIAQFLSGIMGIIVGRIVAPFEDAWRKVEGIMNRIRDALDFTKRHSPSVVDIVNRGVSKVNKAFENLDMNMNATAPDIASSFTQGITNGNITSVTVPLAGAIVADEASAGRMAEMVGDLILSKLKNTQRI